MQPWSYGNIYTDISNSKNAIPSGSYFSMIGQYGHTVLSISPNVSVGINGISITGSPSAGVVKSTQSIYNDIYTY